MVSTMAMYWVNYSITVVSILLGSMRMRYGFEAKARKVADGVALKG